MADFEQLRTFLEVERLRHFRRAAEELNVTQAAVSSRIKQLEELLKVDLFTRQKRQIELTAEGHRFKRYAERLIAEWRKARHDVSLGTNEVQLAVGGTYRVWDAALQQWLHRVGSAFPALALIVESHTIETLVRKLIDGQLDLGFILEPPKIDSLHIEKVAELKLVLVSTKPVSSATEAFENNFVAIDWGLGFSTDLKRLFPDISEPKHRFSQSSIALDFIKQFSGSAFVSNRSVYAELENNELFLVPGVAPINKDLYAIYPVRTNREDLIKSVIDQFEYRVSLPS